MKKKNLIRIFFIFFFILIILYFFFKDSNKQSENLSIDDELEDACKNFKMPKGYGSPEWLSNIAKKEETIARKEGSMKM